MPCANKRDKDGGQEPRRLKYPGLTPGVLTDFRLRARLSGQPVANMYLSPLLWLGSPVYAGGPRA